MSEKEEPKRAQSSDELSSASSTTQVEEDNREETKEVPHLPEDSKVQRGSPS